MSQVEIISLYKDVLKSPPQLQALSNKWDHDKWCEFQNDHGHPTKLCKDLMHDIKDCLKHGFLWKCAPRAQPQKHQRPKKMGAYTENLVGPMTGARVHPDDGSQQCLTLHNTTHRQKDLLSRQDIDHKARQ